MKFSEESIEKILTNSSFTNPVHKKSLWESLSQIGYELSEDELEMAAGGVGTKEYSNDGLRKDSPFK